MDDDRDILIAITAILADNGYLTETASDGRQGLQMFSADPPDLVLIDILMPEMEGIETIREIRASNDNAKIVAMSGGGGIRSEDLLRMASSLGADMTLAKPFTAEELLDTLKMALELTRVASAQELKNGD